MLSVSDQVRVVWTVNSFVRRLVNLYFLHGSADHRYKEVSLVRYLGSVSNLFIVELNVEHISFKAFVDSQDFREVI